MFSGGSRMFKKGVRIRIKKKIRIFCKLTKKREGFWFLKEDGPHCPTHGSSLEILLNYFIQLDIWIMEDFKIYIFVIQKSFLCSLGEISLVYNLHIENKNVVFVWFFSNPMQCPFDVLIIVLVFYIQKNSWSMTVLERRS